MVGVETTNQIHKMETRYRILGPDEVIQDGDQYNFGENYWGKCAASIGKKIRDSHLFETDNVVRRPIPPVDPLVAELVEALSGIMPFVEEDYFESCALPPFKKAMEQAREVLLKSRAALKTYETVDGKVIKCP